MSTSVIDKWADVFKAIGNRVRFKIILLIYADEIMDIGNPITFSALKHMLNIDNDSLLNHHITKLIEAGLIEKKSIHNNPKSRIITIYKPTEKWIRFLKETELKNSLDKTIKELIKIN